MWTLYSPHGLIACCWAHAPDSPPLPTYSLTKLLPLCGAVAGCGCTTCRYSCHIFLTLCYSRNLHRTDQVRNISTIFPPLAFTPCCVFPQLCTRSVWEVWAHAINVLIWLLGERVCIWVHTLLHVLSMPMKVEVAGSMRGSNGSRVVLVGVCTVKLDLSRCCW